MRQSPAQKNQGVLILLLTAFIWGLAFVAQSVAMDHIGPMSFCAARFFLSGFVLIPVIWLRRHMGWDELRSSGRGRRAALRREGMIGGLICGVFLFFAAAVQQIGVKYTTAGKAGFLTTLYIIVVPIYSIALGRRPARKVGVAAVIAMVGMYLLCIEGRLGLPKGDAYCLLCALLFPFQILALDYYVQRTDAVFLSCLEFLTVGFLSLVFALLFETADIASLRAALIPILYAGVLSGAVGYTLQGVGQQKLQNPSAATLIMSLEAVFAVLVGWLVMGQTLSPRKILGCVIMFAAIALAQL